MSVKLIFRGQCVVISVLFFACPLYLPEKVQIKTEPAIYLPLGTPDSLQEHMDLPINDLAKTMPVLSPDSEEIALYDFQGEYGDTRAFIIRMKLMEVDLGNVFDDLELPSIPDGIDGIPDGIDGGIPETPTDIEIDFADFEEIKNSLSGTCPGIDLTQIVDILNKYEGLKFRSVPVYVYIQGPNRIFEDENVTINLKALPDADLLFEQPVSPCELPVFPNSEDIPMTTPLSPKPGTSFDLKDILNQDNPPEKLDFEYEINVGPITVKYDELSVVKEEFKIPLSAAMVLVLPFRFSASQDIPILSEKNDEENAGAIHLLEEDRDLFGRNSADDENEGFVKDVLERMQSLVIHVNIENNLGLAGYAPVYGARPNPGDPNESLLGRMSLSGSSSIAVSKSRAVYPFNIWVEMYLGEGQEFDIKRQAKDPVVPPLKLSLAVVVKTRINETF